MRTAKWIGAVPAVFFLFCALTATEQQQPPGHRVNRIRYNYDNLIGARPLNDAERATVQQAIHNIGTRSPSWFAWQTVNGDTDTAYGALIASDLAVQLADSHIQAETLRVPDPDDGGGLVEGSVIPDGKKTPYGDQLNIMDSLLRVWGHDSLVLRYLEELLVHEWRHKVQDSTQRRWGKDSVEADAWRLTKAYKDSMRMAKTDPYYQDALTALRIYTGYLNNDTGIVIPPNLLDGKGVTIITIKPPAEERHYRFMSFEWGDSSGYEYDIGPTHASDMYIYRDSDPFPPGHHLALICGGNPQTGMAQFLGLHLYDGMVVEPPLLVEFGPPLFPPMYFNSMVKIPGQSIWFVLDSLNHQILTMLDSDGNKIPDEILSVFASAGWPGFEALRDARGIDLAQHPSLGAGLTLCRPRPHRYEDLTPYDSLLFLSDPNGDQIADFVVPLPFWEFVTFQPTIQAPRPWIGENYIMLYATWNHEISVWSCDSTGDILYEWLGAAMTNNGVDVQCLLARPLLSEDYVAAQDMVTGQRSGRPVRAIDPIPKHLVIQFSPDDLLRLSWDAVASAGMYAIWSSDDGVNFVDTGLRTPVSHFEMPLPPMNMQFYHVTALR